jgi:hypothetical protein
MGAGGRGGVGGGGNPLTRQLPKDKRPKNQTQKKHSHALPAGAARAASGVVMCGYATMCTAAAPVRVACGVRGSGSAAHVVCSTRGTHHARMTCCAPVPVRRAGAAAADAGSVVRPPRAPRVRTLCSVLVLRPCPGKRGARA